MKLNNGASILIGLPVYNERGYLEDVLHAVQKYCRNILVVDDGSNDGTSGILKDFESVFVITHDNNEGYGKSLIDMFKYASDYGYDWLITMDCDHQHQPSSLPSFYSRMQVTKSDIISGSRYTNGRSADVTVPKDRLQINRNITEFLNLRLNLQLTDAFCGFKAYRAASLKKLHLAEPGYGFPLELWIKAARQGFAIEEIPVPLIYHDPNRNFAGALENPEVRLNYYLEVINRNL